MWLCFVLLWVFGVFILLFVKCTISAGKETKEILGPEAQTDEAGCTGISLLLRVPYS